jgi:hypothetical protein
MRCHDKTGCNTVSVTSHTPGHAAQAPGKAKSLISRDIRSGRIPATLNDDESVTIGPVELRRVRPPISRSNGLGHGVATARSNAQPGRTAGAAGLEQSEIALLRAVMAEKDSRIAELQADNEDLPCRLDQATALLTDQRTKAASRTSVRSRFPAWWRPR